MMNDDQKTMNVHEKSGKPVSFTRFRSLAHGSDCPRVSLARLGSRFPWPGSRPKVDRIEWALDAGGRGLVVDQIRTRNLKVVLEIGVFLGGSARIWLDASPDVVVIALDPWIGGAWLEPFARSRRQPEHVIRQLTANEESFYETFVANLWDYRNRVIPVRGKAPGMLHRIHELGVQPDLVYLDGDKSGRELEVCHELFPNAILTGDDWFMGTDRFWNNDAGYPIRKPVRDFCQRHDRRLVVDKSTWMITADPIPMKYRLKEPLYHFKSMRRRARGAFRWMIGRDKAA